MARIERSFALPSVAAKRSNSYKERITSRRRLTTMTPRHEVFPHVIEMNYQARRRMGCCVYLVHDAGEWLLIDIGYEDTLDDIVKLIRDMDFPLASCKYLVATHADVDHV